MVLKQSFQYLFSKGIPAVVNFISIIIFSRIIEPEVYGEYALVVASVILFNSIFFQWIRLSTLRFFTDSNNKEQNISNIFTSFLISTFASVIIFLLAIQFLSTPSISIYMLGAIMLIAQGWFEVNLEIERSSFKPVKYGLILSSKTIIFLIIGLTLHYLEIRFNPLIIALTFAYFLPTLFCLNNWSLITYKRIKKDEIWSFLRYGLPLTISSSLMFIINYSDRFFIEYYIGTTSVGEYSLTYDFIQSFIITLMMVINLAAYPIAVKHYKRFGQERSSNFLRKTLKLQSIITIPMVIVFITIPYQLSVIVFGSDYIETANLIMPLLALAIMIKGFKAYYLDYAFQLSKKTSYQMYIGILMSAVNVVLNIVFIPFYGLIGAIYSTLFTFLAGSLFSYVIGIRYLNLKLDKDYFTKYILSAASLLLVFFFIPVKATVIGIIVHIMTVYIAYILFCFFARDKLLWSIYRVIKK